MPLKPGSGKKVISKNIHEMVASGHPVKQAVAASLHNAHYKAKMAEGGFPQLINQKSKADLQADASRLKMPGYAMGGYAEGGAADMDDMMQDDAGDDGLLMHQMMQEHMDAVHRRDAGAAHQSLKAMVHHIINSVEDKEEV